MQQATTAAPGIRRPAGSNWGDFGPTDRLGRLNLLTPAKVLEGMAEVREGHIFSLTLPLNLPAPGRLNRRRRPPRLHAHERGEGAFTFAYPLGREVQGATDLFSDEDVTLSSQYSTQWDAFGHVGSMFDVEGTGRPVPCGYNGHPLGPGWSGNGEFVGAEALSILPMALKGIQGRAVLVDLQEHFGEVRRAIGYDDLMRAMDASSVDVRRGDILCLHTGFAERALAAAEAGNDDDETWHQEGAVLDGSDERLLGWLDVSGIAALAADNHAIEARRDVGPAHTCRSGAVLPLHEFCLFKLGIPMGELWRLTPLAKWLRHARRSAFLLTAPPLALPGAVGSPVTPIATV